MFNIKTSVSRSYFAVKSVFARYVARHGVLRFPNFQLLDNSGSQIGSIDFVGVKRSRIAVVGWALADKVGIVSSQTIVLNEPKIRREDVSLFLEDDSAVNSGFEVDIPLSPEPAMFFVSKNGSSHYYQIPKLNHWHNRIIKIKLAFPFFISLAGAIPDIIRLKIFGDQSSLSKIKFQLGLDDSFLGNLINSEIVGRNDEVHIKKEDVAFKCVSIVVPVYNGYETLTHCINRVIEHTDIPYRLVIVDDCSTDERVRPWLKRTIHQLNEASLSESIIIENTRNIGFVQSANTGIANALNIEGHVVLLNSDALVPSGWIKKIINPILNDKKIASVTPLSNDAQIFSAPKISSAIDLYSGQVDYINELMNKFIKKPEIVDAPTGVGFCMAMNVEYLKIIPSLDISFGRGYGEEVDWCQKVRCIGGRNVGIGNLFVEHKGSVSFGSAERKRLVNINHKIIQQRYPRYDLEVQDFITSDKMISSRLVAGLAIIGTNISTATPIYLAHSMGGGAEIYLEKRVAQDIANGQWPIVIRVGGSRRWAIELHLSSGVTRGETDDTEVLLSYFSILGRRDVVYSCGVGDFNPIDIPSVLLTMLSRPNDTLEILFHDYFPIDPAYTLLNNTGVFYGVTNASSNIEGCSGRGGGGVNSIGEWRKQWGKLIYRADSIKAFSTSSKEIISEAYPFAEEKIAVEPHSVDVSGLGCTPRNYTSNNRIVGILGNIGLQKGAAVIERLSHLVKTFDSAKLVIIGRVDPRFKLEKSVVIHGEYEVRDIPALVDRYQIDCWLIPSVWPETFSFATHEALATQLPVFCFDLGAQAEAVRDHRRTYGIGGVVKVPETDHDLYEVLEEILMNC